MPPDLAPIGPVDPPLTLTGKRVIITEDEGVPQLQYRRALERQGLRVVGCARNAQEAIQIVLEPRPDLVLRDIYLPGKHNGQDAAKEILRHVSVCLVAISAYDLSASHQKAEAIGGAGYLVKPLPGQVLIWQLEHRYRDWQQAKTTIKPE